MELDYFDRKSVNNKTGEDLIYIVIGISNLGDVDVILATRDDVLAMNTKNSSERIYKTVNITTRIIE